jgi:hypothetical protein
MGNIIGVEILPRAIERERQNVRKIILPLVVCRRAQVFFYVVCVCLHIVVSNTYYVVFLFCVLFVLCTQCCQFLWIVHFWLPLRYSLKFIHLSKANLRLLWIISILILTFILKWYMLWEMLFMTKSTNIYLYIRTNTNVPGKQRDWGKSTIYKSQKWYIFGIF